MTAATAWTLEAWLLEGKRLVLLVARGSKQLGATVLAHAAMMLQTPPGSGVLALTAASIEPCLEAALLPQSSSSNF